VQSVVCDKLRLEPNDAQARALEASQQALGLSIKRTLTTLQKTWHRSTLMQDALAQFARFIFAALGLKELRIVQLRFRQSRDAQRVLEGLVRGSRVARLCQHMSHQSKRAVKIVTTILGNHTFKIGAGRGKISELDLCNRTSIKRVDGISSLCNRTVKAIARDLPVPSIEMQLPKLFKIGRRRIVVNGGFQHAYALATVEKFECSRIAQLWRGFNGKVDQGSDRAKKKNDVYPIAIRALAHVVQQRQRNQPYPEYSVLHESEKHLPEYYQPYIAQSRANAGTTLPTCNRREKVRMSPMFSLTLVRIPVVAKAATVALSLCLSTAIQAQSKLQAIPRPADIDARVRKVMDETHANGMAVAVIDHGKVSYVQAYGIRNARREPLTTDTVMYGASLTKTVFAYHVLQLVDSGKLKLDTPIKEDLDQPLPTYPPDAKFPTKYGPYKDLANDPRWEKITPRICLTHSTGFNNYYFMEPDQKLRIHFAPGTQYSYSGEGLILLQFVIERGRKEQGLGIDVGELTNTTFQRLGMTHTSLVWRPDFATNLADGWNDRGEPKEHDERSKVRAAGSMDTTISDIAKFFSALARGNGLSASSRKEMTKQQLHIGTAHQFPTLAAELPASQQRKDLYAGFGVVVFDGPQGHGFFKGGHDDITANTAVCLEDTQRCVVLLSNDVRAEAGFADLVRFILGDTGVPYDWEYGDRAGKS
jgi:CubicO group peptidase (beta-lactamase class C family)